MSRVVEVVRRPVDPVEAIDLRVCRMKQDAIAVSKGKWHGDPVRALAKAFVDHHRGDASMDKLTLAKAVLDAHFPRLVVSVVLLAVEHVHENSNLVETVARPPIREAVVDCLHTSWQRRTGR